MPSLHTHSFHSEGFHLLASKTVNAQQLNGTKALQAVLCRCYWDLSLPGPCLPLQLIWIVDKLDYLDEQIGKGSNDRRYLKLRGSFTLLCELSLKGAVIFLLPVIVSALYLCSSMANLQSHCKSAPTQIPKIYCLLCFPPKKKNISWLAFLQISELNCFALWPKNCSVWHREKGGLWPLHLMGGREQGYVTMVGWEREPDSSGGTLQCDRMTPSVTLYPQ